MPPISTSRDLRFLDPAIIARLGTMELKARTIVEGFLSGLHRSPYKGFSVEFAEYRQYLPGDDLSTLDWKVYAALASNCVLAPRNCCSAPIAPSTPIALPRRTGSRSPRAAASTCSSSPLIRKALRTAALVSMSAAPA